MTRTVGFPITVEGESFGGSGIIRAVTTLAGSGRKGNVGSIDVVTTLGGSGQLRATQGGTISHVGRVSGSARIITDLTIPGFWPSSYEMTTADIVFIDRLEEFPPAGTELRYTLDRTQPTLSSPIYPTNGLVLGRGERSLDVAYIESDGSLVSGTWVTKYYNVSSDPIKGSFLTDEFIVELLSGKLSLTSKQYYAAFYNGGGTYTPQSTIYSITGELDPGQCVGYTIRGFPLVASIVETTDSFTLTFNPLALPAADADVGYSFRYVGVYDSGDSDSLIAVLDLGRPVRVAEGVTPTQTLKLGDMITVKVQRAA